jgi:hypothetical protein
MREDKAADAIGLVELTSPRLQHGNGEVTWVLLIDAVNPPAHSAPNAARQNHETAMKVSPSITAAIAPISHKSAAIPTKCARPPSGMIQGLIYTYMVI